MWSDNFRHNKHIINLRIGFFPRKWDHISSSFVFIYVACIEILVVLLLCYAHREKDLQDKASIKFIRWNVNINMKYLERATHPPLWLWLFFFFIQTQLINLYCKSNIIRQILFNWSFLFCHSHFLTFLQENRRRRKKLAIGNENFFIFYRPLFRINFNSGIKKYSR